jgi:hypothetical protein
MLNARSEITYYYKYYSLLIIGEFPLSLSSRDTP